MNQVRKMMDGNGAAVEAVRLAGVKVISAYPVTPQSPIAERLSELVTTGELEAKYIRVESEHSALSCAIGAQLTGVRAATATSSVGLALMHEVLGVASGCRLPIVMPVVNRALVSPWSLWCDHQDTMAERDAGWLQFYAENVQEVLDLQLAAYKLAEHPEVLLPIMVCQDGFFLSHSTQPALVPDRPAVDDFLSTYEPGNLYLDPADPMFVNPLTPPEEFSEMRYQQKLAFENALEVIPRIFQEYMERSGRKYSLVETFHCQDAAVVLITMGSMSGTAKYVAEKLRKAGHRVGVLRIISFRPFPAGILSDLLQGKKVIGVIDRSAGLGAQAGPLCLEVKAALADHGTLIHGYVAGLGGRDVNVKTMERIFIEMLEHADRKASPPLTSWIDTGKNTLDLRWMKQDVRD